MSTNTKNVQWSERENLTCANSMQLRTYICIAILCIALSRERFAHTVYVCTCTHQAFMSWSNGCALRYIAHFPYCDSVVNALFEHNHMQNRTNQIWDPNRMDNDLRKWHENKICPDMEIIEQIKHQRFGRQKEKIAKAMQFARYW